MLVNGLSYDSLGCLYNLSETGKGKGVSDIK